MNAIFKRASDRLARLEKFNRGKPGKALNLFLVGGALGQGALSAMSKDRFDRTAHGGVALAHTAGSIIHAHQIHKARKMYGHLSDTELDKRINNG